MKSIISLLLAFFIQLSSISGFFTGLLSDGKTNDYKADEIVPVIVELKQSPLLEGIKNNAQRNELLNGFSESKKYKSIINSQNRLKTLISSKISKANFTGSYSYSFVLNGFSVLVPYKYIDTIRKLDLVKNVEISSEYELCDSVDTSALEKSFDSSDCLGKEGMFTGVNDVRKAGYTGKGTVVAVLDSGFEIGHEAFSKPVKEPALSKRDVNLISTFRHLNTIVSNYDHYVNEKIPYRWDYANVDKGVHASDSDHGTHVAGIIGGNSKTLTGVAPDCQMLFMKVFEDSKSSKAKEHVTFAALDDAVKLGADVCNLSYSSECGQQPTNIFTEAIFKRLERAGVDVICSAGNVFALGENDATPGNDTLNPELFDYGTVGSPSTYSSAVSVGASGIYRETSEYDDSISIPGIGSQMMAGYSSMGVSADLKLKPEIVAPGTNLYSSVSGNRYEYMSGTSMSAPYLSGCFALMKQYIRENFPNNEKKRSADFINSVLMSTATPFRGYGNVALYSPRLQGSGLVNMIGAISTKAFLTASDNKRPKLELGEDTDNVLELAFDVHNMTDETVNYSLSVLPLAEDYELIDGTYINCLRSKKIDAKDYKVEYISGISKNKAVSVKPNSIKTIKLKITFSDGFVSDQAAVFKNGFFLDGFVFLKSSSEPTLSLPYVAFYGDWSRDMLFDNTMYSNKPSYLGRQWGLYVTDGEKYYPMGANAFEREVEYDIDEKYCAYSTNALQSEMKKPYVTACVGLLRNGKSVDFNLLTKSGILRYCGSTLLTYKRKTIDPKTPVTGVLWGGTQCLINGRSYVYTVSTRAANYDSGKKTLKFGFTVDNEKPIIESCDYTFREGRRVLKLTVSDNRYVMGFRVLSSNGEKIADVSFKNIEPEGGRYTFELDLSPYVEPFTGRELETLGIYCLDYAYNETTLSVSLNENTVDTNTIVRCKESVRAESFVPDTSVIETYGAQNRSPVDKIISRLENALDKYN